MTTRLLALSLALLGTGCATRVYSPNGLPALNIYSDFKGRMHYHTAALDFDLDGAVDNSRPSRTAFDGISKGLISAGVGAATPVR